MPNIGALMLRYTILEAPYYKYSILGQLNPILTKEAPILHAQTQRHDCLTPAPQVLSIKPLDSVL